MSDLPNKTILQKVARLALTGSVLAMSTLAVGCATHASSEETPMDTKDRMHSMTTEQNKKVFHRVIDKALNGRDTRVFDELAAPNFVSHALPPETPPGPEALKQFFTYFWTAFPDIQFSFEDEVVAGDKIAGRGYFTATHNGEFQGIPATGKKIKVAFMDVWRFENGKWVEYWGQADSLSMLQQLGAIPGPGASGAVGAVPGHNDAGKAFMKAFRENDVEAIAALYAEDAVFYPTDTMAVKGAKDIRANFAGFLGAFTVKEAISSEVQHLTRGDLSFSWGKWGGTIVPKAGGEPIRFEGRFSDLSKLVDGKWVYILDHASFPAKN